uniref:Uncharacterized protein n=1 Tax=viral metagenome TaxID=1070528 RepID=A0A6C0CJU5_9ZZZZ
MNTTKIILIVFLAMFLIATIGLYVAWLKTTDEHKKKILSYTGMVSGALLMITTAVLMFVILGESNKSSKSKYGHGTSERSLVQYEWPDEVPEGEPLEPDTPFDDGLEAELDEYYGIDETYIPSTPPRAPSPSGR